VPPPPVIATLTTQLVFDSHTTPAASPTPLFQLPSHVLRCCQQHAGAVLATNYHHQPCVTPPATISRTPLLQTATNQPVRKLGGGTKTLT